MEKNHGRPGQGLLIINPIIELTLTHPRPLANHPLLTSPQINLRKSSYLDRKARLGSEAPQSSMDEGEGSCGMMCLTHLDGHLCKNLVWSSVEVQLVLIALGNLFSLELVITIHRSFSSLFL